MNENDGLLGGSLNLTGINYSQPDQQSGVIREPVENDKARAENVKRWISLVMNAKKHFEPVFKQMRKDIEFVRGKQWDGSSDDRYVANLTQRHIRQRVSSVYARNPTFAATRRKRIEYMFWDGDPQTMQSALQDIANARASGVDPMPESVAIIQDIQEAKKRRAMIDRIGKTLEILFRHQLSEAKPSFKKQMKQLIRRVLTCKVGYVKLGYQRQMGQSTKLESEIKDQRVKIEELERLRDNLQDGIIDEGSADLDQLRMILESLEKQQDITLREGLVFEFPRSHHIIVDPACTQLNGFVGAGWIAHEMVLDKDEVQKIYGVDIGSNFVGYNSEGSKKNAKGSNVLVWEIYDLQAQIKVVVCDGYPGFLYEGEPDIQLEQFHPFFVLSFNDLEDDKDIYPPSDVELLRPMQMEHNRSREGLREHRVANRPAFISPKGTFEETDKNKLSTHDVNELLELEIPRDVDIRTVLQPKPNNPIDPAVYDTSYLFEDMQRTLGNQEADYGGTSGATATEASISENSRVSSVQSAIDDLDEFMSDIAREAGQVLLRETAKETVERICGRGAVWPEYTNEELVDEVYLEIRAGSSGRPNRAMQIANIERVAPFIIQTPNLNPEWWLRQLLGSVDESLDIDDAIMAGMPSIVTMNRMSQAGTGNAMNDPTMQGGNGGNNAAQADGTAGGGQPAFPT